ncbi:MAG: decaprenyl-phosphate phosphoribosyltransferase [Bacteroidia bacterium]
MATISTYLKLLRAKQWVKNGFLFLPLFFDQKITDTHCLLLTLLGFVAFCLFASAIYILNDYNDIAKDRQHPEKRFRPLASGAVETKAAWVTMIMLFAVAVIISLWLPQAFLMIALSYVILNIFYSFYLKHVPILDITLVSMGFILRVFAGAVICAIVPSMWLVTMTFLLALFIALAKRRDDVLIFLESGKKMRKAIEGYNIEFLNIAMAVMAAVIIVAYLMYTTSELVMARFATHSLYFSTIFVILGLLRYLQLAFVEKTTGSPTDLVYKDLFLQLILIGWVGFNAVIIYFIK